jgi:CheY-like chemotaxis protein
VLLVDDDESIRKFVARVLGQAHYETTAAADASQAIAIADTEGPFDLLVTDVTMPGLSGDALAQRLRRADPTLKILYLTGNSDLLFDARRTLWEDEAFLDKPVRAQALLEATALLLEGRVPAPRAVRVRIAGARVRFGECLTTIDSLSMSGGLIQVGASVPVGSTWPLVLELPSDTIRVKARVVSCERRDTSPANDDPMPFSLAFAFVDLPERSRLVLDRAIQDTGS